MADDLLEGRGTGTRGYELAAKYVAAQFEAMGLESADLNKLYFQPIRIRSMVVVPRETSIKLTRNGIEEALVYGQDYNGVGDPRQPISSLSGQAVYVGHGVTAPDFGIDDCNGIAVHGKIVAFLRTPDRRLPPSEGAHFADVQTVLDNAAAAHGSLGAIQIRDMETDSVQPFARALDSPSCPRCPGSDKMDARGAGAMRFALLPSSVKQGRRNCSRVLSQQAPSLSGSISIITTSRNSEVTSPNIVAVLGGSDPRLPNEYVIYTAHVDHLGIGKPVNGDAFYNGAVEMLRARRVLSRLPAPSRVWNCSRAAPSSFSRRRLRKKGC